MRRLLLLALSIAAAVASASTAQAQYGDAITVSRALVDVRVTDSHGNAIPGLGAADFDVKIDGKPAVVESVTWIDADAPRVFEDDTADEAAGEIDAPFILEPRGRLLVFFIQTDFARNRVRLQGQMNFRHYAEDLIEGLGPNDRVAVFSFDSHLKFRSDFTSDKEAITNAVRQSVRIDFPPPPPTVESPSLAKRLDPKAMRRAASSETGLLLVANALSAIPGPKSLLLMGWGLGVRQGNAVSMRREWTAARRALDASRTSIFSLDTTYADYHDLEIGLQAAAKQTGGFYAKTHEFARGAIERLQRTLAGHYELELRPAETLKPGSRTLVVRVKNQRGLDVLAPSSIIIRN
ncbi:MAG TPA: VWA domain-containing protein [Thermoanaerobaculia bacterium]|nr:VWA domain-containing protein [Thermoanaerobaculia bacterium]